MFSSLDFVYTPTPDVDTAVEIVRSEHVHQRAEVEPGAPVAAGCDRVSE